MCEKTTLKKQNPYSVAQSRMRVASSLLLFLVIFNSSGQTPNKDKSHLVVQSTHSGIVRNIKFIDEDTFISVGDQTFMLWDLDLEKKIRSYKVSTKKIFDFEVITKDLIIYSSENQIFSLDLITGSTKELMRNQEKVFSLEHSEDYGIIYAGCLDNKIKVINIETWSVIDSIKIDPDLKFGEWVWLSSMTYDLKVNSLLVCYGTGKLGNHGLKFRSISTGGRIKQGSFEFLSNATAGSLKHCNLHRLIRNKDYWILDLDDSVGLYDLHLGRITNYLAFPSEQYSRFNYHSFSIFNDSLLFNLYKTGSDQKYGFSLSIWDLVSCELIKEIKHVSFISSSKEVYIAALSNGQFVKLDLNLNELSRFPKSDLSINRTGSANLENGIIIKSPGHANLFDLRSMRSRHLPINIESAKLSEDGNMIALGNKGRLKVIDLNKGSVIADEQIKVASDGFIGEIDFSPNNRYVAWILNGDDKMIGDRFNNDNHSLLIFDLKDGVSRKFYGFNDKISAVDFIGNKRLLIGSGNGINGEVSIIKLKSMTRSPLIETNDYLVNELTAVPSRNLVVTTGKTTYNNDLGKPYLEYRKISYQIKNGFLKKKSEESPKEYFEEGRIDIWDIKKKTLVKSLKGHNQRIDAIGYNEASQVLLTGDVLGNFKLWDLKSGAILYVGQSDGSGIIDAHFHAGTDWFHLVNKDGSITFYQYSSNKVIEILRFISDTHNHVIMSPNQHYYSNKQSLDLVAFRLNGKVYPFEQFDLKYNRPDLILSSIPGFDSTLVSLYHKAYTKRVQNAGFSIELIEQGRSAPILDAVNYVMADEVAEFKVIAHDTLTNLDRINLWVNNVPAFGMSGIDIGNDHTSSIDTTLYVPLSSGKNQIQISVSNENGSESLRETILANSKRDVSRNLLFLGIGVSEYEDVNLNLDYSHKDAMDVASSLTQLGGYYQNIDTMLLINEGFNSNRLRDAKEWMLNTTVDDHVIVFFSGHGLLDDSLNYYLATSDTDFNLPQNSALPYNELVSILDSIPSRQKLMLIDACHSGEADEEDLFFLEKLNTLPLEEGKLTYKGFRIKGKGSPIGLSNSFELMRELFADIRRFSGAIVISSSGGGQFSLEGENNGIFTSALLEALQVDNVPQNKDGILTVNELQSYLIQRVPELSWQQQVPTFREQNIIHDFRIY